MTLKYYRELKGISQKELAKVLEITQKYISKVENRIESPTVRMISRFTDALEICPRLLLPCIIEYKYKDKNNYVCEVIINESSYLLT